MSNYMTEAMKPFFRIEQHGYHPCRRCKRKVPGAYCSYQKKLTPSIDGSMALRIFFVCNERSHMNCLGYNKRVDLTKGKSALDALDGKTFEDEEGELELEWKTLEENARLRRRTFAGASS